MVLHGGPIIRGSPAVPDDVSILLGTDSPAELQWDAIDANANLLKLELPAGGAVDVPVLLIGRGIIDNDLGIYNGITASTLALWENSTGTEAPVWEFRKSRGTAASPTVIAGGDNIGAINAYGYSGVGGYVEAASIEFDTEGVPATTNVRGVIIFRTATDAAPSVLTTALTINSAQRSTFAGAVVVNDDLRFGLGSDLDDVLYHRTAVLGANTAITDVLAGTPVTPAIAANSLILSNVTASGDWLVALNRGGNSEAYLWADSSAGDLNLYSNGTGNINFYPGNTGTLRAYFNDTGFLSLINVITAPAAAADEVRLFIFDGATDDARLRVQSEVGSAIELGNNGIRFLATTGAFRVGGTAIFSSTETLLTVAVDTLFDLGVRIGANSTNNEIDDASQGTGSTTLYIGNASINVTSDKRLKKDILDWQGNALDLLRQARIVEFGWNDPSDQNPYGKAARGRYVGMLAQETIDWAPWVINAPDRACPVCKAGKQCLAHPTPWFVEYEHMVPLLVKGIQEIDGRVAALERLVSPSPVLVEL